MVKGQAPPKGSGINENKGSSLTHTHTQEHKGKLMVKLFLLLSSGPRDSVLNESSDSHSFQTRRPLSRRMNRASR